MILEITVTALLYIGIVAAQGIYRNWDVYRGRRTTYDALAEHINEQTEIDAAFPDDSQYVGLKGVLGWLGRGWKKWNKISKPWEAFGERSRFWFARFRSVPVTLFAIGGEGPWRGEDNKTERIGNRSKFVIGWKDMSPWYLSRQQLWKRWHLKLDYPLFVSGHFYPNAADVLPEGTHGDRDGKYVNFYFGFKRDTDNYWIAFGAGRNPK